MVASFKASERWKSNFNSGRLQVGRLQNWLIQELVSKNTKLSKLTRLNASQAFRSSDLTEPAVKREPLEDDWQAPTWDEVIVQLGQEIKALREAQSITLQQIHAQTKVPLYHLRALESGQVQGLPEPIFVRGFLTQICKVLGENGPVLLAKLPDLEPVSIQLAVERQAPSQPGLHLAMGHLYLAYATLLAGAVGGLVWIGENETNPTAAPPAEVNVSQRDGSKQDSSKQDGSLGQISLGSRQQGARLIGAGAIATTLQPERMPPELSHYSLYG